jgi:type VI secretion system protein ImpG
MPRGSTTVAPTRDELIAFYQRELQYLRHAGADFARAYPKVAARLELGPEGSADPHVERLIESFAYLAARIQRGVEAEFPRFTEALLGVLYPQLAAPVPSMALARFEMPAGSVAPGSAVPIPRGTPVSAMADDDLRCRFRTCYDATLWPVEVADAAVEATHRWSFLDNDRAAALVRVTLRGAPETFAAMAGRRLRIHVAGDPVDAAPLTELLLSAADRVAFVGGDGGTPVVRRSADCVSHVGFAEDEAVLRQPPNGHPAYRLLHEYFVFPDKFRFFDLEIPALAAPADRLDVLFLLPSAPPRALSVGPERFLLGCTPIVNLFPHVAEPMRVDRRRGEYRVVPDVRLERVMEVHSVVRVVGNTLAGDRRVEYRPYFSADHTWDPDLPQSFWIARRAPTDRREAPGTDVWMSFVDLGLEPSEPPDRTILVHCLCTNRMLAEQVPAGARLYAEQATGGGARITCITRPTPPRPPPMQGRTPWRLVSHLSLNYLSLSEGEGALPALREILRLYAPPLDAVSEQQILGVRRMDVRHATRRIGRGARGAFARGLAVSLEMDEGRFVGASAFLLAAVLDRFLPLYASVNAFTQLTITSQQRSGTWHEWPARIGGRPLA